MNLRSRASEIVPAVWGRAPSALLMAFVLLGASSCAGPTFEPWHTEHLKAEFTAEKADLVRTFDDYRRLEDALSAELDEKVYSRTETGPEYALYRFSAGSAADPHRRNPNWNRSFELDSDAPAGGVLLLHGMSDSPYSLRAMGEALHREGYWVVGLRLPGHGTAPSGLKHISWQDLAAAVLLGVNHLASKVGDRPIHLVGYSTGAALALSYTLDALEEDGPTVPASLVLVSPAIGLHPTAALAGLKNGLAVLPGLEGLAWLQVLPEFDPYRYNSFATNAGAVVHRLTQSVAQRIRAGAETSANTDFPPTLVFLSTVDATVSTDAVVDRLLVHLPPDRNELVLFDINRCAVKSKLLVSDPAPLTESLMANDSLPFAVTFVTNETPKTTKVHALRKTPFSSEAASGTPLNVEWPLDVVSLSHIALTIPPDDPLYGRRPPDNENVLFLGQMPLQGERGVLRLSGDWLLRLRYNPFYDFLGARLLEWIDDADQDPSAQ